MRILRNLLPLLVLLLWSTTAKAQYNPTDPPEPGVYFTLTTQSVPSDGGNSFSGAGTYAFGSNVNMRVRPTTGYRFICWEDEEGTVVSTSQDFTYTMPAKNVRLTARFEYNPTSPSEPSTPEFTEESYITFRIVPSDAGYMYDGSNGKYEVGTRHNFTVRGNSGYKFINWTRDGIEIGTSTTLNYTVPSGNHTLVANFEYDPTNPAEPSVPNFPRRLNLLTNLDGAASLSGGGSHEVGSSFTVSASRNTYYHFVNWTDDEGNTVSESSSFTYTMPNRDVTLTANFTYNYDPSSPGEPGTPNPDSGMAENMVLWPRMGMYDDTHVQILCETPGATIHYTLDGTTPNSDSPVYTEPVFVGSNLLVKAIAYKEGMEDSPVVNYRVTVYKAATPVYTFENRKIKITSETPDAIIRYTLDFTNPNEESTVYTEPFEPEENCRIKAYASKEGLTDSPINTFVFRRADYTIPAPTFSIDDEGRLVITPAVIGGQTYYTLDGTDPTTSSALYTEPLLIDGNFRIRACTVHPNYYDSLIGEYSTGGFQVETPTCDYANLVLTLASATPGATLRYTLDGTIPSEESTVYTAPLRLTEDCQIVARGYKENYDPSDTVSYTFVLADHKAVTPVLTYDPETLTVTMTSTSEDAEIRYTIDGEAPTATTGIVYTGPVAVVGNHTYTARAFRSDLFDSASASVTVDDQKAPTPASSYAAKLLTLSCPDAEATIHYTTDGTTPTADSATYAEPLTMSTDCTVKFIAVREFFIDSDEAEYVFRVSEHQVAAPVPTYDPATLTVTMTCASENAEIRYTIDGEAPTATTGTVYTGPIAVVGNHVYTARAFRSDLFDSASASVTVDDQKVQTPASSYAPKQLPLS
ncbi:MAG: chitobiase/beta-hexosaminidase C-terminal domain-containing protein, partial [Muribaculaceae bacterium]|nr:chitobiase/beta-hexosaminidase C-terminal domain-containing protein [Muribaculaceae bacterium]